MISPLPPRRSTVRSRAVAGFTLVEVMIASFVMIFGISSAIIVLKSGVRSVDNARNITLASQILQSELERVRMLPWASDTGGESITGLPGKAVVNIDSFIVKEASVGHQFEMVRTVDATLGRESSMRDITLYLSWRSTFGTLHNRTFTTRYCKDGLYDYYYTLAR